MLRSIAALIFVLGLHSASTPASACRDCPFPSPLAALHWRMPGGYSEIMVEEINLGRGRIQSVVRMIDAQTGSLLAIGYLDHTKGRKRIKVDMVDAAGGKIAMDLYYLTARRDKVQIKLTCQQCTLKSSYLN